MNTPVPRPLRCPFRRAFHPHVHEVSHGHRDWLRRTLPSDSAARLAAQGLAEGVALAFPQVSDCTLRLLCDWASLCFGIDDYVDTHFADERRLADDAGHWLSALRAQRVVADVPFERALANWSSRAQRFAVRSIDGVVSEFERFVAASLWEARNRRQGSTPRLTDYWRYRLSSGATPTYLAIVDATLPDQTSLTGQAAVTFANAMVAANRVTCLANDLFSASKEAERGDFHNAVLLVAQESRIGLADALDMIADEHDAEVASYLRLRDQALNLAACPMKGIQARFDVAETMMRGHLDFVMLSKRYAR